MDSPTFRETNERGLVIEAYPRFLRVIAPDGEIVMEYGAAHVVKGAINLGEIYPEKSLPTGGIPKGSVFLDRYGNRKPSRKIGNPIALLASERRTGLIKAVRAMKHADVSHMQNDDNGCGPAVVARLNRTTYDEAARSLFPSGHVRILGTERLAAATGTKRHACKSKEWREVFDGDAVAALIKNEAPHLGNHYGHFVAIEKGRRIIDPEMVLPYTFAEYPRRDWTPLMYFTR